MASGRKGSVEFIANLAISPIDIRKFGDIVSEIFARLAKYMEIVFLYDDVLGGISLVYSCYFSHEKGLIAHLVYCDLGLSLRHDKFTIPSSS